MRAFVRKLGVLSMVFTRFVCIFTVCRMKESALPKRRDGGREDENRTGGVFVGGGVSLCAGRFARPVNVTSHAAELRVCTTNLHQWTYHGNGDEGCG